MLEWDLLPVAITRTVKLLTLVKRNVCVQWGNNKVCVNYLVALHILFKLHNLVDVLKLNTITFVFNKEIIKFLLQIDLISNFFFPFLLAGDFS